MTNYKVVTDAQNTGLDCEVFATQGESEQAVETCKNFAFDAYKFYVVQTGEPVTTTFEQWNAQGW